MIHSNQFPAEEMSTYSTTLSRNGMTTRDIRILRNCRRAMHSQSRLLVIEHVAPDKPVPTGAHQRTAVSDAVRLAISGGRTRTLDEHNRLLEDSGFQVLDMRTTAWGDGVIEAVRP